MASKENIDNRFETAINMAAAGHLKIGGFAIKESIGKGAFGAVKS